MESMNELQPFAQKYMSAWRWPWLISLGVNALLVLALLAYMMTPAGPVGGAKEVEISLVGASAAGASAGPKIAAPAKAAVAPPKPLSPEAVKAIKDGVPVKEVAQTYTATTPSAAPAATATAVSEAGGGGASLGDGGDNAGGSGEAEGSGSGGGAIAAPPAPHEPVVEPPQLLNWHQPTLHVKATVTVRIFIDENGNVTDVTVVSAEGDSRAVAPSVAAARGFRFTPKTIDGVGAPSSGTRTFIYR